MRSERKREIAGESIKMTKSYLCFRSVISPGYHRGSYETYLWNAAHSTRVNASHSQVKLALCLCLRRSSYIHENQKDQSRSLNWKRVALSRCPSTGYQQSRNYLANLSAARWVELINSSWGPHWADTAPPPAHAAQIPVLLANSAFVSHAFFVPALGWPLQTRRLSCIFTPRPFYAPSVIFDCRRETAAGCNI